MTETRQTQVDPDDLIRDLLAEIAFAKLAKARRAATSGSPRMVTPPSGAPRMEMSATGEINLETPATPTTGEGQAAYGPARSTALIRSS